MGKHERETVQQVEKSVVSILNGEDGELPQGHPWTGHDVSLAQTIGADHPALEAAEHQGNRYDAPGDIKLTETQVREPVYVEVKVSDSKDRVGTAANITQDALTKYEIVTGIPAWSTFRSQKRYEDGLRPILDEYEPARSRRKIPDKGRVIRDAANGGESHARDVRERAIAYANEDRLAYLHLVEEAEPNGENLRLFTLALLLGAHTEAEIKELFSRGLPASADEVPTRYAIYYTNVRRGQVVVRRHAREHIVQLLQLTDFSLDVDADERFTCRILARREGGALVEVLRFIPHWKNVFIGIQTPCLNVFLGEFPRALLDA